MWSVLVAAAIVLVLAAATAGAALAWHVRSARRRATEPVAAPCQPSSVDPRGRWRISRLGDDLVEPATYRLRTDPDGPVGDLPSPVRPACGGAQSDPRERT